MNKEGYRPAGAGRCRTGDRNPGGGPRSRRRRRATVRSASTSPPRTRRSSLATTSGPLSMAPGTSAPRFPTTTIASAIGIILRDEAEVNVRTILDDLAATRPRSVRPAQQVGDFYASWMDEAAIEAQGHRAAQALSRQIAAVNDVTGLHTLFAPPAMPRRSSVGICPTCRSNALYCGRRSGRPRHATRLLLLPGEKYDGSARPIAHISSAPQARRR